MEYHARSKLWPGAAAPRTIDAALIPRPYKVYATNLPTIDLPEPSESAESGVMNAIVGGSAPLAASGLDLATIATLLRMSAGIVRRKVINGREVAFRAASCTGSAYHVELYLVSGDVPDLGAGVYHFGVHDDRLRLLRSGDFRGALAQALGDESSHAPEAYLVLTSVFWRNAWRYEERAYRHAYWDSGTILANLLAVAADCGVRSSVAAGFVDGRVNALVGVDGEHEAAVALVRLGPFSRTEEAVVPRASLPEVAASAVSIEFPAINRMHEASSLVDAKAVQRYRVIELGGAAAPPLLAAGLPLDTVIRQRRSTRRFATQAISQAHFMALMASARSSAGTRDAEGFGSVELSVIVHAVEGVDPGVYRWRDGELCMERPGVWRERAVHLALDQDAAGQAAVNFCFWSRLPDVLAIHGNRGYRAAQLAGAISGGRVYLAAHALGLGATGLTFYDDEMAGFLGLPAAETVVLFLVVCGRAAAQA